MRILKTFALSALLLVTLTAMSCEGPDRYQPAAIPPIEIKVPTFVKLPAGATTPCPDPVSDRVPENDVELMGDLTRWKAAKKCSDGKLGAIDEMQP